MPRIAVIRNPHSGTAPDTATLTAALDAVGISADVLDIPGSNFEQWIDRVAEEHDVIAASGGDGTVSSVAAAVVRANKTLAVLPTGTLNHFAKDVGIPTELEPAIALLRDGVARAVDVGTVNGHCFLNNVSLGNYPRMVHEREALERRGRSKRIAGVIAVASTWWRLRNVAAALTIDGRDLIRSSPFILISNGSYVLSGFALGQRENISDHRLSLYVAPATGRLGVLSLPMRALVGTLDTYEQFETFHATRITIALGHRRVSAGVDGEILELATPLKFAITPGALRVLVQP